MESSGGTENVAPEVASPLEGEVTVVPAWHYLTLYGPGIRVKKKAFPHRIGGFFIMTLFDQ